MTLLLQVTFSEKERKITPQTHIGKFEIFEKIHYGINIDYERKRYNMSPAKNRKRPFFNFDMKFMMYLGYSF